ALLNVIVVLLVGLAGFPLASCTCTVTLNAVPAVPELGTTVKANLLAAPAVKVTVAVCVMTRLLSVTSVAGNTSAPAVVDLTVNVATPKLFVVPETTVIVGVPGPDVLANVTALPETGLLLASFNVTVTVDVVVPFATTDVGAALTVDWAA